MRIAWALVVSATLGASTAARADLVLTVNTTEDGVDANPGDGVCATAQGKCTLRAAVMESNHTTSGTVAIVVPANSQPYVLAIPPSGDDDESTGDLNISRGVTITGAGAQRSIIDGNGTDRVFRFGGSGGFLTTPVLFSDLTIRNGATSGDGGAFQQSVVTCCDVAITFVRCVVTGNSAARGGAIAYGEPLTLDHSTVSGNTAAGVGGGIFGHNVVMGASTVSGNTAATEGGGLYLEVFGGATSSIFYSTIAGNMAGSNGFSGQGGGVFNASTTVTVTGSIISGNNIVTNPFPTLNPSDCAGVFGGGTNLVSTKSGCTITAAVGNPLLGPLQLNGGQLPTRALAAGSPAVDMGNPFSCAFGSSGDERGAHRPEGAACDLGAYERTANGDVNGDGTRDVADVFYLINFLFAGGAAPIGLGDVNGDAATDVTDVFYMINFLFAGGAAPL